MENYLLQHQFIKIRKQDKRSHRSSSWIQKQMNLCMVKINIAKKNPKRNKDKMNIMMNITKITGIIKTRNNKKKDQQEVQKLVMR